MYTYSGRGRAVGRGDNRPLGFYGVGALAGGACGMGDAASDAAAAAMAGAASGVDQSALPTGTATDPASLLAAATGGAGAAGNIALVTGATGGAVQPPSTTAQATPDMTNWIILGVAAVGLMVMLGRR